MEQTLTAKLKILPTPSEAELLMDTMRTYSEACNYVSNYVFSTHDTNLLSLNRELYHAIREKYSLPSQMAQSVLRTVVGRYKAILTSEKWWIRPKFRTPQLDLVWNRDYSLVSGHKIKEKRAHFKMLRKELQQVRTPSSRRRLKTISSDADSADIHPMMTVSEQ